MKKHFAMPIAALMVFAFALTACGGSSKAKLTDASVYGEIGSSPMAPGSQNFVTHQVNFFEGNVYQYISTEIIYGYSMLLGTTTNVTYGTYTVGASEDGITSYTLNQASEVIFNSFSLAGGYNISINTASKNQAYPVELLASGEGEKVYADSKEDVINAYGVGTVIYCDDKNTFTFTNPNSESTEKAKITTPSGSVSNVLTKEITNVQVASEIVEAGIGVEYNTYQVMTFADNSYELIRTSITYGYSMLLGTTTIVTYGTCEYGTSEDGYTPLSLSEATDVVFNSYSKAGGYNISINTIDPNQTYPVELLASGEGEKVYAQDKEGVILAYGQGDLVYSSDDSNAMSLINPNA